MEPTVELTSQTEGNFLTPVTEQFTKEPFNLDELVGLSSYKERTIQNLQASLIATQAEKDAVDAKIEIARAGGAKTSAEIQAESLAEPVQSLDSIINNP